MKGGRASVGIQIQGTAFTVAFFTLSLGGCDVALGVQWLLSLRSYSLGLSEVTNGIYL